MVTVKKTVKQGRVTKDSKESLETVKETPQEVYINPHLSVLSDFLFFFFFYFSISIPPHLPSLSNYLLTVFQLLRPGGYADLNRIIRYTSSLITNTMPTTTRLYFFYLPRYLI